MDANLFPAQMGIHALTSPTSPAIQSGSSRHALRSQRPVCDLPWVLPPSTRQQRNSNKLNDSININPITQFPSSSFFQPSTNPFFTMSYDYRTDYNFLTKAIINNKNFPHRCQIE